MIFMKKSMIAVIIGAAGVLAATAAISAAAITANNNKNDDTKEAPVSELSQTAESSAPGEIALPEDKQTVRNEIRNELSDKQTQYYREMVANGEDPIETKWKAKEKMELEQLNESVDILKKYNKLGSDFSIKGFDDNIVCLRASCDLLTGSEGITQRERVYLELLLERGYYALRDKPSYSDLMNEISNIIELPN